MFGLKERDLDILIIQQKYLDNIWQLQGLDILIILWKCTLNGQDFLAIKLQDMPSKMHIQQNLKIQIL